MGTGYAHCTALYWRWEAVNRASGAGDSDSGRVGVVECGVRVRFDPLDFGEKGVQRNSLASIWSTVASMLWLYEVLGCKKSVINSPDSKEEFKELVIKSITDSEEVQWNWTLISQCIVSEDDALWVTIRGFSITALWMETFKIKHKNHKEYPWSQKRTKSVCTVVAIIENSCELHGSDMLQYIIIDIIPT